MLQGFKARGIRWADGFGSLIRYTKVNIGNVEPSTPVVQELLRRDLFIEYFSLEEVGKYRTVLSPKQRQPEAITCECISSSPKGRHHCL